jgi:hypothetical protein
VGGREAEVLAAGHVPSPGLPGRIGTGVESLFRDTDSISLAETFLSARNGFARSAEVVP